MKDDDDAAAAISRMRNKKQKQLRNQVESQQQHEREDTKWYGCTVKKVKTGLNQLKVHIQWNEHQNTLKS